MLTPLILATGVLHVGCSRLQSKSTSDSVDLVEHLDATFVPPDMSAADVESAIQNAVQCDRAIIFVHVDWSSMELIVELKSVEDIRGIHNAQLLTYTKLAGVTIG